ncbi:hypothetical protein [Falsiroseomonas tokyonensis]|uniref:Uncharacterized protein n=1 Tax=Falsiroseomonas tokyonensis TaxID=430521 RepID=A0ABV7BTP2_9PROT|nr:hypothetical protein [Falsiroseomonas tokyonensis]MBU8537820.1 hypothetical protein [Falsiroseomonas tokyonensis]
MRILGIIAPLILLLRGGCEGSHLAFLDPQGPVAAQQRTQSCTTSPIACMAAEASAQLAR